MRKYLIIAMLTIVSCAPKNIQGTLDTVEACIESRPDSAKTLLESIKLPLFATRELKARNALLNTIALDKNYIDLTTDSIIAPAVRHYTRRGTPDARFKTQYYLGRIRQNAGDNEAALDCFVKASVLEPEVTDTLVLARCYSAQGVIYSDFYDYENAIEANRKAAELFLAAGNVNSYVNNILKIADCYWNLGSFDKTMDYVELVGSYKKSLSVRVLSTYYSVKLKLAPTDRNNKQILGATYGMTRDSRTKKHSGLDLYAEPGTPIYSMFDGVVTWPYVTEQPVRNDNGEYPLDYKGDDNSAGNRIYIQSSVNGEKISVGFWHLMSGTPVAINPRTGQPFKVGDTVYQGELIAYTGITGNANKVPNPHLHLAVKNSSGAFVDPEEYINGELTFSFIEGQRIVISTEIKEIDCDEEEKDITIYY